jgi:hypothetical protein
MADAGRAFIPLEVDDRLLALSPQYETHLIWHVPELKTELHPVIRKCVADYHQQLFDAATDDKDEHFVAMAAACNDTLAARHPCFPAETFAEPRAFRKCLIDHHIAP